MEKGDSRLEIVEMAADGLLSQSINIFDTTIFRCLSGEAVILLNGQSHSFVATTNFIIIESAHMVVEQCSRDFTLQRITFGRTAFNRIYTHIDSSILSSLKFSTPDMVAAETFRPLELTLEKICLLNESHMEHRRTIMRNLIFCYIYEMYELTRGHVEAKGNDSSKFVNSLISRFIILCRDHHTEHRDISFYSGELSISRRYLHTIVVGKLGVTPKEFIDGCVVSTAKRLLLTTSMSLQQISEQLGFSDQSSFGQFFRRITGSSPTKFRQHT